MVFLGTTWNHLEAIVAHLSSIVCKTCHAALNAIACMCQTICDVTSSNVLGRFVQCEIIYGVSRKGETVGGGLVYIPKG